MVSIMESNVTREDLARQLHEIERGRAAPWVTAPSMGWWWAPAFGVWTATYTLTLGLLDGVVQSVVQLAHVLVMLAAIWWMRRVRGTYPTGRSPRELHPALGVLVVGALVVALVVWGADALAGTWVAAGVGLVLAWALVAAYEHLYARAAARVRQRLG